MSAFLATGDLPLAPILVSGGRLAGLATRAGSPI